MNVPYGITAIQLTIYFNKEGDHDHNGLLFVLNENLPILKYIQAIQNHHNDPTWPDPDSFYTDAKARADVLEMEIPDGTNPDRLKWAQQPHPLVRPLVLRCNKDDTVEVTLTNEIRDRWIGLHLVSDGYDVMKDDGSHVGQNNPSIIKYNTSKKFTWVCKNEGVFPFHDGGNYSGGEDGTNVHGLFGALIVEPPRTIWRDPVTGRRSRYRDPKTNELVHVPLDGLYLDVIPEALEDNVVEESYTTLVNHVWEPPKPYFEFANKSHREFVIFFHDEPEFLPPHGDLAEDPCPGGHGGGHGGHGGHGDFLPIMPVSYRAEPMINRERKIWALLEKNANHFGDRPVLNEEQHHSSWMFGDPVTPILKAYIGDPVRIRFVHAAVKETHVFHLHMYEWHAVPEDKNSPRIDAISVSPQTAHTIEPVWGAGNRHQVAGDVIWHCHLYPHFHEGMWGIFRTFETLQEGEGEALVYDAGEAHIYEGRKIGFYPDHTPIEKLLPLPDPDRKPPPLATPTHPGFPLFIPGKMEQKSPIPPWPDRELSAGESAFCGFTSLKAAVMPGDFDYRSKPYSLERNAFNKMPYPGELFTRNPFRPQQNQQWTDDPKFEHNGPKEVCRDVIMAKYDIKYNDYNWHDKDGHLYYLKADGDPLERQKEPLFFRALHGQILNLTFENLTPFDKDPKTMDIEKTEFDPAFPPCEKRQWQGECAMHVHMVKFDPICGDGASTGWNYISGPVAHKKMVYRWWLDREFGTIFFHDHLFANYRQKHGLFGALIVEPVGSKFYHPKSNKEIVSGLQARIKTLASVQDKAALIDIPDTTWAREFCIGIGDFIPMWKGNDPLNPPPEPGGHGDQGVMALNYRSDPIAERMNTKDPTDPLKRRLVDPSNWFTSLEPFNRDPYTTLFLTYRDDPIWFRVVQGSHEEQHSFQVHGMRWQRFRGNASRNSPIRNQQTFGISEAFTFVHHESYGPGDYMYKLSGADDLWLGCWGIIRALRRDASLTDADGLLHLSDDGKSTDTAPEVMLPAPVQSEDEEAELFEDTQIPAGSKIRHFRITVERKRLIYRKNDLVDPFGLVYTIDSITDPDGKACPVHKTAEPEPLVIRCREGEWVRVTLRNKIPKSITLKPEPYAPEVPVENTNPFSHRPDRPVSSKVSMHADLLKYDVRTSDGANVGRNKGRRNKGQAVNPESGYYYYEWNTERKPSAANEGEPLGPILLQDMADFRNHRHHGLIGALIIEYGNATPYYIIEGEATAREDAQEAWHGTRVTVRRPAETDPKKKQFEEGVLLMQDGLRLFLNGNIHMPISNEPPAHGEDDVDHEDQGQKGFNYKTEPVGPRTDPAYDPGGNNPPKDWLANPNPATPIFHVPKDSTVRIHLLGAQDKPRNQSFTIHGVTWQEWRFLAGNAPRISSESAITSGTSRVFEFTPIYKGDHAYRSGVLKWAVPQGLWGILRVQ
jgi:hypothetical protein